MSKTLLAEAPMAPSFDLTADRDHHARDQAQRRQ
jgi:hypothetical protein